MLLRPCGQRPPPYQQAGKVVRLGATGLDRPLKTFGCGASCKKVRQTDAGVPIHLPFNGTFFLHRESYLELSWVFLGYPPHFDAELSEIIMEINDLGRVGLRSRST